MLREPAEKTGDRGHEDDPADPADRDDREVPVDDGGPGTPGGARDGLTEAAVRRFELLGLSSAVVAALEAGALTALVEGGPRTSAELSSELGVDPRVLERVLALLATTDLVRRVDVRADGEEPGRYGAGSALAALRRHGPAFAVAELEIWRTVSARLAGEPFPRNAPGALDGGRDAYADIVRDLSRLARPAAGALARELDLPPDARVLDVGCGAGAWSLALAEANRDARITGLDLPEVVPRFADEARRRGLDDRVRSLPGDMHDVRLEPGAYDLVIVANVLRLETKDRARRLLGQLAPAVKADGALLIVDAFPGRTRRARRARAAYRLHLALRVPDGAPPAPAELAAWLRERGFGRSKRIGLDTDAPIGALLARRGASAVESGRPNRPNGG